MSQPRIPAGFTVATRNGRPYLRRVSKHRVIGSISFSVTPATVAAPKPVWVSQAQYDKLKDKLGEGSALDLFRVRGKFTGKPIPTKRADGDGGTCPYFGVPQHWMRAGVDSTNEDVAAGKCGFRRDGHYATKEGFDAHLTRAKASGRV
jgi:hypothetical protein